MALQSKTMPVARVRGVHSIKSGSVRAQRVVVVSAEKSSYWPTQYETLVSMGLKSIEPEEAEGLASQGKCLLVDVRPKEAYDESHIPGSVSIPLYQALDWSSGAVLQKALKFMAYSFNGVKPIEPNPNIVQQLQEASEGGKKGLIMLCEAGGTMKPSVNFPQGKASRSLVASYRAYNEAGLTNIMHLNRGLYGWFQAGLPFEGEYKPDVGRTPNAASEPTLKILASARGYEMRPGDKR
ncbi:hypothetical protein CEUSTIGMA_g3232.t1 [Chlamydomonas eustigma]|uniref:Rhodanese domain-containing protein n=1 Tax=Chlamydomonas eustigma TaxID=1157962 RepID=A0A250WYL6_9CHLO|nr:hypothetical protein CEUSTIGMA_g3232.t1 [Chlamydomonas eustigma]|eukprot:GAX75789.1 hypothetical protein CEUSTIGMA_g3232.t1 [Chlamydomonas eustigma]